MKRILVLCTGNSCRSQLAEVFINKIGQGEFEAVSAGAKPSGYVHPLAIRTLIEAKLPTEGLRSKSWEEFKDQSFDIILTVCDNAKESCPVFPGKAELVHWSIPDPADATGTDEEKMVVFRRIFGDLQQRLRLLVAVHSPRKEAKA